MKKFLLSISLLLGALAANAQGWPANYGGVMLQGFYWDSFKDTKWAKFEKQAAELGNYFSLVWVPQSGFCGGYTSMGYDPLYYFFQDSAFGSEAELRSMIKAFKDNGIGTIADVVVNHRKNLGVNESWVDFPVETYNGVTYQMLPTDICSNDEAASWASTNKIALSSNSDTGENWDGMRDLDHKSSNVNKCVKAYVKYLVDDLGYTGFRYDMVKGFAASYVGMYNTYAQPQFSVGEHWGNVSEAKDWINGTTTNGARQSAAFDFQFHYRLYDAVSTNNWNKLNTNSDYLTKSGSEYNRYSVTFVENHDTQYRSSDSPGSCPISSHILACNAFMLAHPGTPCVFLKHWLAYKNDIKKMISARKLAGINNTSTFSMPYISQYYTSVLADDKLLAVVGSNPKAFTPSAEYKTLCEGDGYVYYVKNTVDTSGWNAILERIAAEDVAEPEEPYTDHEATIYVKAAMPAGWASGYVNYWVWSDTDGSKLCTNKTWPGDKVTQTKTVDGETWFYCTYTVTKSNHPINIVLSTGTGTPQTLDFKGIENDTYLEILPTQKNGKNQIKDVTSEHTSGIKDITADEAEGASGVYGIDGRYLGKDADSLRPGLYVVNGKKMAVRR